MVFFDVLSYIFLRGRSPIRGTPVRHQAAQSLIGREIILGGTYERQ